MRRKRPSTATPSVVVVVVEVVVVVVAAVSLLALLESAPNVHSFSTGIKGSSSSSMRSIVVRRGIVGSRGLVPTRREAIPFYHHRHDHHHRNYVRGTTADINRRVGFVSTVRSQLHERSRLFSVAPLPYEEKEEVAIEDDDDRSKPTGDDDDNDDRNQPDIAVVDSDLYAGLRSRPIPNGNWMPGPDSLTWAQHFGRRSEAETARLHELARSRPPDDDDDGVPPQQQQHYDYDDDDESLEHVTVVRTKEEAAIALRALQNAPPGTMFHACDTEVMHIDLANVGPIGNGYVTCVSVYSGRDFDYGLGRAPGSTLWIDNLDESFGILSLFKPWFENEAHLKVWHNYGFDRHVMWNEGIDCKGFGGDTMHMARLQNTARLSHPTSPQYRGYSLEALTGELLNRRKRPMKEIFGVPRLRKDGTEGSLVDVMKVV